MSKFEVTVQLLDDAGDSVWGYHHVEVVLPNPEQDVQAFFAETYDRVQRRLDEAGHTIAEQSGRGVGLATKPETDDDPESTG